MELEEQVMGIIINAGQSRSLCYEALHAAKAGDFATADAKMQEAAHYSREAHLATCLYFPRRAPNVSLLR